MASIKKSKAPTKNPFSDLPVTGLADFAFKETGVRLHKPRFKGKPIASLRVRPTKKGQARLAAEKILEVRNRGARFSQNQSRKAQLLTGPGGNPKVLARMVDASLEHFQGWNAEEISRIVYETERLLYRTVLTREQIAEKLNEPGKLNKIGLGKKAKKSLKVEPIFVWLVEEFLGAERTIRKNSIVNPKLGRLIFRQFDKFGIGISTELNKRHGLPPKTLQSYRKKWVEKNRHKPKLYRMRIGRSVQGFVRLIWKLQHYKFHGAITQIAIEEAVAGETIAEKSIYHSYLKEGNPKKNDIALAMETEFWEQMSRDREKSFEKSTRTLLRAKRIKPKQNPEEAKELTKRAKDIFDRLHGPQNFDSIAKSTGTKLTFVKLVNTIFEVRK